jgi:hypothetical protein
MSDAYDPYLPDFDAIEARPKDDLPEYLALVDRLLQLLENVQEAIINEYNTISQRSTFPASVVASFYGRLGALELTRTGVAQRLKDLVPPIVEEILARIQAVQQAVPAPPPAYDFDKWLADLKTRSGPERDAIGTDVWTALDVLADGFKSP